MPVPPVAACDLLRLTSRRVRRAVRRHRWLGTPWPQPLTRLGGTLSRRTLRRLLHLFRAERDRLTRLGSRRPPRRPGALQRLEAKRAQTLRNVRHLAWRLDACPACGLHAHAPATRGCLWPIVPDRT